MKMELWLWGQIVLHLDLILQDDTPQFDLYRIFMVYNQHK